jgi:hypothetical protein
VVMAAMKEYIRRRAEWVSPNSALPYFFRSGLFSRRGRILPEYELPEVGKISPEIFEHVIKAHLGASRDDVLVGPRHGVDVGVVDIGGGRVMAQTTDPFFIVPEYGMPDV